MNKYTVVGPDKNDHHPTLRDASFAFARLVTGQHPAVLLGPTRSDESRPEIAAYEPPPEVVDDLHDHRRPPYRGSAMAYWYGLGRVDDSDPPLEDEVASDFSKASQHIQSRDLRRRWQAFLEETGRA